MVLVVAALAGYLDWRFGRFPNWLAALSVSWGVCSHGMTSIVAAALCALILPTIRPGWIVGGGDCKLLASLGALHPAVGLGVALAIVYGHGVHLSRRIGRDAFGWTVALLCLLEVSS